VSARISKRREQAQLDQLLTVSPEVRTVHALLHLFLLLMRERKHQQLRLWMEEASKSGIAELKSFVAGVERDYDAVKEALRLPWSQGITEGKVNKLKTIKRVMYGRAGCAPLAATAPPGFLISRVYCGWEGFQRILPLLHQKLGRANSTPASIRWIERHLGLGHHTLIYHYPKETKLVVALYRAHLAERSRQRKEQIDREVTTATLTLDAQGIFPSELRVSKMLSNPNWMRSAEGLTAWHAARRKLGLEE
jgi:hypothetical protein